MPSVKVVTEESYTVNDCGQLYRECTVGQMLRDNTGTVWLLVYGGKSIVNSTIRDGMLLLDLAEARLQHPHNLHTYQWPMSRLNDNESVVLKQE